MTAGFAAGYSDARGRFRRAAGERGAEQESHTHPRCSGPDGGSLSIDTAWVGPRTADDVLVCVSGTHGVEGLCGSACQVEILGGALGGGLPSGTAALFVHALNPYGMAHDRRVNEDNVDLNRNGIDHAAPPAGVGYEFVHDALVPPAWAGPPREAADRALGDMLAERGRAFVQTAITHGQWSHPDGLFYGGRERAWSTSVLAGICAEFLIGRRNVGYIDLHTGLGEHGQAERIFRGGRDAEAFGRAEAWFGPVTRSEDGTSSSTPIVGNTAGLVADMLGDDQQLTAITLEFGTYPGLAVLTALRADNWLRLQADPDAELRRTIVERMREVFCPADTAWRATVVAQGRLAWEHALAGLCGRPELGTQRGYPCNVAL